jgi:hypothetical protein
MTIGSERINRAKRRICVPGSPYRTATDEFVGRIGFGQSLTQPLA